jgi:hypothetical protein
MESLPPYVSIGFILTTFVTVGFLLQAVMTAGLDRLPSKLLLFLLPLWILLQAVLGTGGFYQATEAMPPRLFVFGVLPAILLVALYFLFFRTQFIEQMPLRHLTLLHLVRIPVEVVLFWLYMEGLVPRIMTFAGWNFDILSGMLAIVVYFGAFGPGPTKRWMLVVYNIVGLLLLINIVSIAIMSLPTPLQRLAFDHPNRAVLLFPYVWLPTIIVPIVLFSHLAALWKLAKGKTV